MLLPILITLLAFSTSKLTVQAPPTLVEYFQKQYPSGQIPYSIANYGEVPYGKTISGQLGLPSVLEDCVYQQLPFSQTSKHILLVQRNDCTFTQKSINVQKEGGKLAVIMDNIDQNPERLIMVDDGRGAQVHIPTILISEKDGEEILQALKTSSVVISVTFELTVREKSTLSVWLDITEHKNFVFLRQLQPYFNKISQHVDFSIAYPTRYCPTCDSSDCFYNGLYCRSDYKYWGVENKGQLLIMEQLKQYFIFQKNQQLWWKYVMEYDDTCDDLAVVEECSDKIMKKLGINAKQIKSAAMAGFGTEDNPVLRDMHDQRVINSIVYYPSVVINSIVYRGNLQPFEVYEVICDSLDTQPEGCSGYVAEPQSSLGTWIIFVVVLTLAFGIFLVVCFRRMARRQLAEKINSQVNELVNQYITMYEHDRYNQATELPQRASPAAQQA